MHQALQLSGARKRGSEALKSQCMHQGHRGAAHFSLNQPHMPCPHRYLNSVTWMSVPFSAVATMSANAPWG